ncbi:peptide transporter [Candidatus Pelagibacter ubique]|nr:peptide transporter [Candidatus Pelagibacter bacterium]MDA8845655.1 peptide transporter [Candidatus Pelagibacter bacterium]MDB9750513.1 peptide transporter [Candidatus Pelagibacter ubique]
MKAVRVKELFSKKNYEQVIVFIESNFSNIEQTSEILNILGVSKLQKKNSSNFDLLSAIENFRECYLKEKNTNQGIEGLLNFIASSNKANQYEDSIKYFKETELTLGYIPKLFLAIVNVYKILNDIESVIYYLKKIMKKEGMRNEVLQRYIYFNGYLNKWSQKDFFENTIKLEEILPQYNCNKINIQKTRKIKLAFLSADIKNEHSIAAFLKTIIKNVNKDKFELILFSNSNKNKEDETPPDLKIYFDKWINIQNLNDIEAINIIRKNNINIMIDLMGLSSLNRLSLFKNRLAPIQVLWLGYNNTSGLSQMDYLIADPNLIKKNEVKFYSEKILFLPNIWNCHSGFSILRKENPAPLINNNHITFGSFNNTNKISDEVVSVWSNILKSTNNSRLIIKSSHVYSDEILKEKFEKNKVLNQIIFLDRKSSFKEHIDEYKKIDLALDTFPYNGVTTSFEAIWMGVPILTLKGFNPNSRAGESINKNLNMNYLIADNKDEYLLKAIELSKNFEKVIEIRKNIFDKALESNLFNDKKFSKEFYESLEKIYLNHSP